MKCNVTNAIESMIYGLHELQVTEESVLIVSVTKYYSAPLKKREKQSLNIMKSESD